MESFEKTIEDLNSKTIKTIEEQKLYFAKSIHKLANETIIHNAKVDEIFSKQFCDMFKEHKYKTLNPHIVVEMKDGKPLKVIDSWNHDEGILPNIKFVSEYYVLEGLELDETFMSNFFGVPSLKLEGMTRNWNLKINTLGNIITSNNHNIFNLKKKFKRDIHMSLNLFPNSSKKETNTFCGRSYWFEVDNYMNLYHPESGLYLMFNKIPFPDIAFILRDHTYLSKKTNYLNFEFNKSVYDSIDNRDKFLENINELIPPNYQEEIIIFKKLRDLMVFSKENINKDLNLDNSIEVIDSRDKLIETYKLNINILNDKLAKLFENYNEIKQLYDDQNTDLKDTQRKLIDLEKKEEISESDEILNLKKEIVDLKFNIFELQKQLFSDELTHETVTQLNKNYIELELKHKKLKDQNKNLTNKFIKNKELIKNKDKFNNELNEELLIREKIITDKDILILELKKKLESKESESDKLKSMIKNKESCDDFTLEKALNERIQELEMNNKELTQINQKLHEKLKKITLEMNKIKSLMNSF
uniref:Uncharacterized protein n=1 Tax=viral metagenome TaxID=1070528 RepID=A0A6C0ADH5_9ZZZZ